MVLRERIELSTSPLPRECSTTELPQRAGRSGNAKRKPLGAAFLPQRGVLRKHAPPCRGLCPHPACAKPPPLADGFARLKPTAMTQSGKSGAPPRSGRADRLRAALRENLKRRRAQAKGRARNPSPNRRKARRRGRPGRFQLGRGPAGEPGKAPNSAGFCADKRNANAGALAWGLRAASCLRGEI